jgi:hypothetical protein
MKPSKKQGNLSNLDQVIARVTTEQYIVSALMRALRGHD